VHALAFRSIGVCYLFVVGVGQAATVRMAYLYARGVRPLEVHAERALVACGLALVALVLAALVAGAGPLGGLLAAMVRTEWDLAAPVAALLRVAGLALAAMIPAHMITALLRARDDVAVPTGFTMASYWGVALTAMLLHATAGHGARGVWLALLLGASLSSLCFAAYVLKDRIAAWVAATARAGA
jgi:Na+-driven multidrug efflux pump